MRISDWSSDVCSSDLDEIAEKAIAAFGLAFSKRADNSGLHEPLLRWTDFTLRYVAPTPRQILISDKFPVTLPAQAQQGLHRIEQLLMRGEDVNAYQGNSLTHFQDTSRSEEKTYELK